MNDSQCRPELLKAYLESTLDDAGCQWVEAHLEACDACRRQVDEMVAPVATALHRALPLDPVPASVVEHVRRITAKKLGIFRTRTGLVLATVVGLAVLLTVLGFIAAPKIIAWWFPGGDSSPVTPVHEFLGLRDPGFEHSSKQGDHIGDWQLLSAFGPKFADVDSRQAHTGNRSVKINLQYGSGNLQQSIPIRLPAHTRVVFGAYVLSPQAGSPENKWFSLGATTIPLDDSTATLSAKTNVFAASPVWTPTVLEFGIPVDCQDLRIELATAGDGKGKPGKAVWVDDLYLAIIVPVKGTHFPLNGELAVRPTFPKGYGIRMVVADSVVFKGYSQVPYEFRGRIQTLSDGSPVFVFDKESLDSLSAVDPDRKAATGEVKGRMTVNGYSVAFTIGLNDATSRSSP